MAGIITSYVYSPDGLVAEINESNAIDTWYGYAPNTVWGASPLFMEQGADSGYYINDQLGAPLEIVSGNGSTIWQAERDAFGRTVVTTNDVTNNIRMPGQYYDFETDLFYNWNRYYDPDTGRYVQSDPYGLFGEVDFSLNMDNEGFPSDVASEVKELNHLYGYANQNPNKFIDPYGLRPTKNPRGPDGKPITHGCKKMCIVNFVGTSILGAGAGWGFGALVGKSTVGAVAGHFGSNGSSTYSYFSLGTCLKQCEEDEESEGCN